MGLPLRKKPPREITRASRPPSSLGVRKNALEPPRNSLSRMSSSLVVPPRPTGGAARLDVVPLSW
jgi:hypothetical protein